MQLRTLYLCYFGLREPLVQTQVLPYLRQMAAAGIDVYLLTFEPQLRKKWDSNKLSEQQELLKEDGIRWFCLPYHKKPSIPATFYDILAGARLAVKLIRSEKIDVLHARAHVPMAMALLAQRFERVKLIFDIRGLMAEEYADAGIWHQNSRPFRWIKRLEHIGIRRADQIVVLTNRLRDWLIANELKQSDQIEVIPCCVDFGRFDGRTNIQEAQEGILANGRFEVVYAGSLGGLYLVEEMGYFFKAIKEQRPDAFLRILSASLPEQAAAALKRAGVDERDYKIEAVAPVEVFTHLRRARLGVSFRKPTFAQIASSPTKIPEYLAAGLPVVCNADIGDMDELVKREQIGVVLHSFDEKAYKAGAAEAIALANDDRMHDRAMKIAHKYFDLTTVGRDGYVNVYRRLAEHL